MKGVLFVREDDKLLSNNIFSGSALYGMKSDNYMYVHLRNTLNEHNISLDTQDVLSPLEADFIICLNETAFFQTYKRSQKNQFIYLILSEPPVYNYKDWQHSSHLVFDKVFTYNSDLVDNKKYFHYNFPIDFCFQKQDTITINEFKNKKHSIIVAGAISINPHPAEYKSLLYERFKLIKWFNKEASNDLDFFARTHPLIYCGFYRGASIVKQIANKLHQYIAQKNFKSYFSKVYKGAIPADDKIKFLANYKFSFCFENTYGIKGLISEKIFDCFMTLNVPIYHGAPDISNYIPAECFIQYDNFSNYNELRKYLHSITADQYIAKQKAIIHFMLSEKTRPFKLETFSNLFLNHINSQ